MHLKGELSCPVFCVGEGVSLSPGLWASIFSCFPVVRSSSVIRRAGKLFVLGFYSGAGNHAILLVLLLVRVFLRSLTRR